AVARWCDHEPAEDFLVCGQRQFFRLESRLIGQRRKKCWRDGDETRIALPFPVKRDLVGKWVDHDHGTGGLLALAAIVFRCARQITSREFQRLIVHHAAVDTQKPIWLRSRIPRGWTRKAAVVVGSRPAQIYWLQSDRKRPARQCRGGKHAPVSARHVAC